MVQKDRQMLEQRFIIVAAIVVPKFDSNQQKNFNSEDKKYYAHWH